MQNNLNTALIVDKLNSLIKQLKQQKIYQKIPAECYPLSLRDKGYNFGIDMSIEKIQDLIVKLEAE